MDDLLAELQRTNDVVGELVGVLQSRTGNTQTVIHKNEGMGAWAAGAIAACFCTYLALIIFAVWSIFQINNLTAWKDVYGRELAAIKQQITSQEKRP
jgi:hypothetical protein